MSREKYIFKDSSRIYKQADELAFALRHRVCSDTEWFSEATLLLEPHGLLNFQSDEQWLEAIAKIKQHAESIALTIDPRIAIPALLESVDSFYYGETNWKQEVPICGSALKATIAMIWPNHRVQSAIDKSAATLHKLVSAVMAWQQLVGNHEHFSAFEFNSVKFHSKGFSLSSERDRIIMDQWNAMAAPCGQTQRTIEHSQAVIFKNPKEFSEAVSRVLSGEKSKSIELFTGTVFALAGEKMDFWLGLKARLVLLEWALLYRLAGSQTYKGVVLFEKFSAEVSGFGLQETSAQASIEACFWQEHWYRDRTENFTSNMIVERPVLRIDNKTFATSALTIIDSINCFVENSVFNCIEFGGIPVNSEAFQKHISLPFEQDAIDLFERAGWKVSGVTQNGYWAAGNCQLEHPNKTRIPGEIDVLALHSSGLLAMIVECKVLTQPYSKNKLKNIIGKLGPTDQESFHSNLERKVNWLAHAHNLHGAEVVGALLIDQGSFLGEGAPHPVVDLERLHELLTFLDKEIAVRVTVNARTPDQSRSEITISASQKDSI